MRVHYVFSQRKLPLLQQWRAGQQPDTLLFGYNHLAAFGIRATVWEPTYPAVGRWAAQQIGRLGPDVLQLRAWRQLRQADAALLIAGWPLLSGEASPALAAAADALAQHDSLDAVAPTNAVAARAPLGIGRRRRYCLCGAGAGGRPRQAPRATRTGSYRWCGRGWMPASTRQYHLSTDQTDRAAAPSFWPPGAILGATTAR